MCSNLCEVISCKGRGVNLSNILMLYWLQNKTSCAYLVYKNYCNRFLKILRLKETKRQILVFYNGSYFLSHKEY
jgi:hypothetical protein